MAADGHLDFGREGGVMGAAGHRHAITCQMCRTRDADFECSCEENCNWMDCPKGNARKDPLDYGHHPVPKFK